MNDLSLRWSDDLPYSVSDLEEGADSAYRSSAQGALLSADQIRCCVRSCDFWLSRRRRGQLNCDSIFCPQHGISVSSTPTYIFKDYRRNFIVSPDLVEVVEKVERWRLGNENSEDALTWNVLLGLSKLGGLRSLFELLTGLRADEEPELYLWGNQFSGGRVQFWSDLRRVRRVLEERAGLPTEPDAALRVPGVGLVLIEAKFGSANGVFAGKEDRFGAVEEYLGRYHAREEGADPLSREWIEEQRPELILEQLCRNAVFAHWLVKDSERAFVANLVRRNTETDIEARFAKHINPDVIGFRRVEWEQVYGLPEIHTDDGSILRQYFENKTLKLARAFAL